ncbi:VOC family protein [Aliarcobacter butzleri]|uniref:hypothetical protein n=1 Tax=Aliarcobacter butzleri TaxID=28197 RepID=UPI001D00E478|nr:hypothetical protein [Aliarcobacter butzleri]
MKVGSADLCFIVEQDLEDIVLYLQKEKIKIEEGIVERTGANGKIKSRPLNIPCQSNSDRRNPITPELKF